MSASNEMKRYRLSYRHGVIEEDGSPHSCDDSKPMYLCAEADAALLAKDEVIAARVPRSRYDACNADWLAEKERANTIALNAERIIAERDTLISQLRGEVARSQWMQSRLLRTSYFDSDGQRCWYVFNLEGERLAFGGTEIEAIDAAMAKP